MPSIDPKKVPRLSPGVDLLKGKFSLDEGRVLALVDGVRSAGEITGACGLARPQAEQTLLGLHQRRKIYWFGEEPPQDLPARPPVEGRSSAPAAARPAGPDFEDGPWMTAPLDDPRDLEESVDLGEGQKRKILYLHKRRQELTHYQFLGLARRAEPGEVKKAYFAVSKEFHPDTYFRKNLGTFKARIEALFKRVTQAYEVLGDPQKRAAYDATLPYEPTPEELARAEHEAAQRTLDEKLTAERRERLARLQRRKSPQANQRVRAREHYEQAVASRSKDPTRAFNAIMLAVSLEPDNEEYQKLRDELQPKAGKQRAEREFRQAWHEQSVGNLENALKGFVTAVEADPDHWEAKHRAAQLMLDLNRDLKKALAFCRDADRLKPDHGDVVLTLAQLYEKLDMKRNALREYERYPRLRSHYVEPDEDPIPRKIKELRKRIRDEARETD
ncbi:MAG TPA: DnaJ domain-containing protein [Myxococcota bacterium]|nr:DnaJ domain-containing protein [Myxococcota bacterium]HRY96439.1 DnaJ domain-containing protein [Myxococcota bacterium]